MSFKRATTTDVQKFYEDGYVIIRSLFDAEEMSLLITKARADSQMLASAQDRLDDSGKAAKLAMWQEERNDLYGMFSRCPRIVDSMEKFLGGEVYHYHSKMSLKEPNIGGAWEWHQDYGYWYTNGILFPYMASCYIALDPATKENGCLQVLKGSHHMGRINHESGDQFAVDLERLEAAIKQFELVYCEMDSGDALFFHGNLLHASAANTSPHPRWGLICCYNAARNDPYKDSPYGARYTPLKKVADTAIKEVGRAEVGVLKG
jgi:ectoine hydroxylase-related dioxygenase (phytanoyl-CoA dioxygenase family)